jgi:ATP/maltotriose-dependent transcriptional regulator MalT
VFQRARIEMRGYRARAALALAAGRDGTAFRRAEELAALLARERAPWADALAALVRATLTHHRGSADAARMELEAAETLLAQCDMHHYAAAARYRRGCLTRGAAGRLVAQSAVDWMTAHRFVNPVRFADLFAPGRW